MKKSSKQIFLSEGFSLIELLIIITIISTLSSIFLPAFNTAREKAIYVKAQSQFASFAEGLALYKEDHHGRYPNDGVDEIPAELIPYIPIDSWGDSPWSGSNYDWENWADPNNPGERIYQLSIRFCPWNGPLEVCGKFPRSSWANDFEVNSSIYYCFEGVCRSHIGESTNYPGYCVNCEE